MNKNKKDIFRSFLIGTDENDICNKHKIDNKTLKDILNLKIFNRKYSAYEKRNMVIDYLNGYSSIDIEKEYNIRSSSFIRILHNYNIPVRNNSENSLRYSRNSNYFEVINSEEKAYWLGFLYADGYITRNQLGISLAEKDKKHLIKFLKSIGSNSPIKTYFSSGYSNSKYCRVLITDNKITNDLIKHGVFRNKSNILKPPTIKPSLYHHFIRGYFDGDGCITYNNRLNRRDYSIKILSTESLLDFIKEQIHNNNIAKINNYYKRKIGQIVSSIDISGNNQVEKFLNYIYKDATIYLDRKYEKFIDFMKYRNCPTK